MTTISLSELLHEDAVNLNIPEGLENLSLLDAAQAYADAGWYVLPVDPQTKNPGSVVGSHWHQKSSRNRTQIQYWFSHKNFSIALHVGRSNAIAIDVDYPENLPEWLQELLNAPDVPYQSTRSDVPLKGHYLFKSPNNIHFSNSTGSLGSNWGDVRGDNGVIIASPSSHSQGGHYRWVKTGPLTPIPDRIMLALRPKFSSEQVCINLIEIQSFITENTAENYPQLLDKRILKILGNSISRGSRHQACLNLMIQVMIDVRAGFYSASSAINKGKQFFDQIKPLQDQIKNEFTDIVNWSISFALSKNDDQILLHQFSYAPHLDKSLKGWIDSHDR